MYLHTPALEKHGGHSVVALVATPLRAFPVYEVSGLLGSWSLLSAGDGVGESWVLGFRLSLRRFWT